MRSFHAAAVGAAVGAAAAAAVLLVLQIIYHVGVSAILCALGFFDKTAGFAGASGGAVAAAYSCSRSNVAQVTFRTAADALLSGCRIANNCRGTLDMALRIGALSTSCAALNTTGDCANKLHIAVTQANKNSLDAALKADQRVFVSGSWTTTRLTQAVAASAFIPRFSAISLTCVERAVTQPTCTGVAAA
jgi:hypothetical protein